MNTVPSSGTQRPFADRIIRNFRDNHFVATQKSDRAMDFAAAALDTRLAVSALRGQPAIREAFDLTYQRVHDVVAEGWKRSQINDPSYASVRTNRGIFNVFIARQAIQETLAGPDTGLARQARSVVLKGPDTADFFRYPSLKTYIRNEVEIVHSGVSDSGSTLLQPGLAQRAEQMAMRAINGLYDWKADITGEKRPPTDPSDGELIRNRQDAARFYQSSDDPYDIIYLARQKMPADHRPASVLVL